jgi:hypothetical protein
MSGTNKKDPDTETNNLGIRVFFFVSHAFFANKIVHIKLSERNTVKDLSKKYFSFIHFDLKC